MQFIFLLQGLNYIPQPMYNAVIHYSAKEAVRNPKVLIDARPQGMYGIKIHRFVITKRTI